MKFLIEFSIRHRRFVAVAALLLLVAAGLHLPRIPVDVLPDVNDPSVVVMTEAAGLPAEEVETMVTVPIERALFRAPRLRRIRSSSASGLSIVTAEFEWGTDALLARQVASERLQAAADELPEGAGPPVLGPITSRLGEVVEYVLVDESGRSSLANLREIADRIVRPRLSAVRGVAEVGHMGGDVPQFHVIVDPQRLADFRITLREVLAAVEETNVYAAGGFLKEGAREIQVLGLGRTSSLEDFEKAVVRGYGGVPVMNPGAGEIPVTIESLGEVALGAEVRRGAASFQGREAVLGKVSKNPGADTFEVTRGVLDAIRGLDLHGVRIEPIYLQEDLIRRAVRAVVDAVGQGSILVLVVIGLFLFKVRPTLICVVSIPLSILLTVLVLHYLRLGINVMTLGGLAIAVGEVVDDSIVDVDNVHRRLVEHFRSPLPGVTSEQVTLGATLEVRSSVFFATAIVLLVFVPLLTLGGVEGRMFAPLGVAVIVAMASSLLVSWIVTPALCQLLMGRGGRLLLRESPVVALAQRLYRPVVDRAIAWRLPIVVAGLLLIAGALLCIPRLGTEFIPRMDEGTLVVNALLSPGTSLEESFAIGQQVERRLLEIPGVISAATRTGRARADEHAEGVHYNEILVNLDPAREGSREEIEEAVREKLRDFPGVFFSVGQPISHRLDHLLSGVQAGIAIKIFGTDLPPLRKAAEDVRAAIAGTPGVADLLVEPLEEVPTLRVDLDRDALALYGFTAAEVVEFVNAAFNGEKTGEVIVGPVAYTVLVRLGEAGRQPTLEEAMDLRMQSPLGEAVPLKEIATLRRRTAPDTIRREDLSRRVVIQCNAVGRDLGSVVAEIRDRVEASVELPEGTWIQYGGQWESQQRALRRLGVQLLFLVAGMFVLLFFGLGTVRHALVAMLSVPLALVGGVATVWITGRVLSVSSAIGFVLLFGIAVRNGILLVGHINDLRAIGLPLDEAIRRGARERVGPVLMTALSTGLGMLPLALSGRAGAEIEKPLAMVLTGGMISATLLTLVVLPALYALVEKAAESLRAGRE